MGSYRIIQGDVTRPEVDGPIIVIGHCCNNVGKWGAGVSGAIGRRWPQVEAEYRETHPQALELGSVQFVNVQRSPTVIAVANIIGQEGVSPTHATGFLPPIRYTALAEGFRKIGATAVRDADNRQSKDKFKVHLPMLGAGLAGGDWRIVEFIIRTVLVDDFGLDVTVYEFNPTGGFHV